MLLMLLTGNLARPLAQDPPDRGRLGRVVLARAGAVRVDVIHVRRRQAGVLQSKLHRQHRPGPVGVLVGDAKGVRRAAVAGDFRQNRRPAFLRVFQGFEHEHPRALAQHEPAAVGVERPAGGGGVVVALAQRGQPVEAGDAQRVDHRVRPADEHHVGRAVAQDLRRLAGRLAARGARRQTVERRPPRPDLAGDVEQRHVRLLLVLARHVHQPPRRPRPPRRVDRPLVRVPPGQGRAAVGVVVERPLAAAEVHAHALRVRRAVQPRVVPRLPGRPQGKGRVPPDRPVGGDVVIRHLRAERRRERRRVEQSRRRHAALPRQQPPPHRFEVAAHRRDPAHARDDNPSRIGSHAAS